MASIYYANAQTWGGGYNPAWDEGAEPILLASDNKALNSAFAEACVAWSISLIELREIKAIKKAADAYKPWAVIMVPGYIKMENLRKQRFCYINIDPHGIPSYMHKLAHISLGFLVDEKTGIWNLSNESLIMQAGGGVNKYIHS